MVHRNNECFFRCRSNLPRKIGVVIPPSARMNPDVARQIEDLGFPLEPPTTPPHRFSFHYIDAPFPVALLEDNATINTEIYEFSVRDAVLAVFDQPFSAINEFCWAFSTSAQTDVLAAVKIGQIMNIEFDQELLSAEHVIKSHFPSGLPDTGYGAYASQVEVAGLSGKGFRLVSSFEPASTRTNSRLPFFMGFRVFGTAKDQPETPLWREVLGHAVREALFQSWEHALLFAAFALESFLDRRLKERLSLAGLGEKYTEHVLQVAERKYELHALNAAFGSKSIKEVNKDFEYMNMAVFTPRNKLAHGVYRASEITEKIATDAIRAVIQFIWDNDKTQRELLLPEIPSYDITKLIDTALLEACVADQI